MFKIAYNQENDANATNSCVNFKLDMVVQPRVYRLNFTYRKETSKMNIEIANRLVELRKEKGYSQESLAAEIGISRQSVSKWERAESSPDTDNLICLAKLYGVSLDELLNTTQSIEDIVKDKKSESIFDDDEEDEEKDSHHLSKEETRIAEEELHLDKWHRVKHWSYSILTILVLISYFLVGYLVPNLWGISPNTWGTAWVLFLLIPLYTELYNMFLYKDFSHLTGAVVFIATIAFFVISYLTHRWEITWICFLLIPLSGAFKDLLNAGFKWGPYNEYYKIRKNYHRHDHITVTKDGRRI